MESLESFLQSIGEDRHLDTFMENEIDMELLKTLPEKKLKDLLAEIGLKPGTRMKIITKREALLQNKGTLKRKF